MVQLNYDDNAASVFGVTLLLFYLVPSSIYILYRISTFQRRLKAAEEAAAGGLKPRTELERKKLQSIVAKAEKPVLWSRGFKTFVIITGAAALLFLYLLLRSSGHAELAQYDPYEILGVSRDAADPEINRAYRKLARVYHPDMPTGDADMFQKVKKAHDALTDPVVKENYRLYGNPDGRQALEVSVGLPNMLKGGSGWLVLAGYVGALVVVVPMLLTRFWRRNKDTDVNTGFHKATSAWLGQRIFQWPGGTVVATMPEIVGGCRDFENAHPWNPADEPLLAGVVKSFQRAGVHGGLSAPHPQVPISNAQPINRVTHMRNALFLTTHLNRTKLFRALKDDQEAIAGVMAVLKRPELVTMLTLLPRQTDFMVKVAAEGAFFTELRWLQEVLQDGSKRVPAPANFWPVMETILHFSQMATQACSEEDSDMKQVLPEKAIAWIHSKENKGGRHPTKLAALLELPADELPLSTELSEAQKADIKAVLPELPRLRVEGVVLSVMDRHEIHAGEVVRAEITIGHANLASPSTPVPKVFAPAVPLSLDEEWWVILTDEAGSTLPPGIKPAAKRDAPLPRIMRWGPQGEIASMAKFTPKTATDAVTLTFRAPVLPGLHKATVRIISKYYRGLDITHEIAFEVLPPERPEERPRGRKRRGGAAAAAGDEDEDYDSDADGKPAEASLEHMLVGAQRRAGAAYDSDIEDDEDEDDEDEDDDGDKDGSDSSSGSETNGDDDGSSESGLAAGAGASASAASASAAAASSSAGAGKRGGVTAPPAAKGKAPAKGTSAHAAQDAAAAADAMAAELEAEEAAAAAAAAKAKAAAGKGSKAAAMNRKPAAAVKAASAAAGAGDDDSDEDLSVLVAQRKPAGRK